MVFSSLIFLCVFLPVVFIAYQVIPWFRVKNILLIAASLLFYAYGEPVYVLLMVASTLFNYVLGRVVRTEKRGQSKPMLVLAVAGNLAVLAVFKYADMLVGTLNAVTGLDLPLPQITLPIGISFFTFQALSYVIDVYRGDVASEKNYLNVLLYISFFPQLIAGPIVKYHDIADQIKKRCCAAAGVARGLRRFCVGLGKKVLIANTLAVVADTLYAAPSGDINILAAWLAAIAYMLQIYFDFSAYSDMAIGLGHMFGFEFKENFDYPYKSTTIKEFWRRWHISLSTWFKEYLYFPLGGNRKGRARASLNKGIVFFLCGLWHGASWTFVLWGLFHGLFLLLEEYLPLKKLPRWLGHIYVLLVVCLGFVLFRADTLTQAGTMIAAMFTGFDFGAMQMSTLMQVLDPLTIFTLAIAAVAALPVKNVVETRLANAKSAGLARYASYAGAFCILLLCLLELSGGSYNPFIYFRF